MAIFAPLPVLGGGWHLLPAGLMTLGGMISRPFVSDMVPGFAGDRPTGIYFGAMASAGGLAVLVGYIALGPVLNRAVTSQPEAAMSWIVLAILLLLSALAMMVLTQKLRQRAMA